MALNPAAFVTPYTAVGTASKGAGTAFGNMMLNKRQQDISQGYLGLQTRQQDFNEKKYADAEVDEAHKALLGAIAGGDPDAVEAAANNMRAVGSRYGLTIDEIRSDRAQANLAGTEPEANRALEQVDESLPTEAAPPTDTTAEQEAFSRGKVTGRGSGIKPPVTVAPPVDEGEEAANGWFDAAPAGEQAPSPSTGMRPPSGTLPRSASAAEPPGASEAPLRGYTVRGPDGKVLYQISPKDVVLGQRERVKAIFDGVRQKLGNGEDLPGLNEAEEIANGLVGVLTPQQAATKGLEHFQSRQAMRGKVDMMKANKRGFGGGGGATAPAGGGYVTGREATAMNAFGDDMWKAVEVTRNQAKLADLNKADQAIRSAEQGLANAKNPAEQRFAVQQLIKAMSGLTVSVAEDQRYQRLTGLDDQLQNYLSQLTGDEMSPEYVQGVMGVVQNWRALANSIRQEAANEGAEMFKNVVAGRAPPERIDEAAGGVYNMILMGSSDSVPRRPVGKKPGVKPAASKKSAKALY